MQETGHMMDTPDELVYLRW